jgi:hypothetical protein
VSGEGCLASYAINLGGDGTSSSNKAFGSLLPKKLCWFDDSLALNLKLFFFFFETKGSVIRSKWGNMPEVVHSHFSHFFCGQCFSRCLPPIVCQFVPRKKDKMPSSVRQIEYLTNDNGWEHPRTLTLGCSSLLPYLQCLQVRWCSIDKDIDVSWNAASSTPPLFFLVYCATQLRDGHFKRLSSHLARGDHFSSCTRCSLLVVLFEQTGRSSLLNLGSSLGVNCPTKVCRVLWFVYTPWDSVFVSQLKRHDFR